MNNHFFVENIFSIILGIVVIIISIISRYKIFQKAGRNPWLSLVPFLSDYILFDIAGKKHYFWSIIFPPIFVFLKIISQFYLAKKFSKNEFFAIGMIIFPIIFYPILAFDKKGKYDKNAIHSWKFLSKIVAIFSAVMIIFAMILFFASKNPGKFPFLDNVNSGIATFGKMIAGGMWHNGGFFEEKLFHIQDETAISWEELEPHLEKLQKGDILFTAADKYTSSYVIPGQWKHTFLYLGNGEIIDASGSHGVTRRHIIDLDNLRRGSILTGILAYRPNLDENSQKIFLEFVESQIGKTYDFGFKGVEDDSLYCSDLISLGLEKVGINIDYRTKILGFDAISPVNMVDYIEDKGLEKREFTKIFLLEKNNFDEKSLIDAEKVANAAEEYCQSQGGESAVRYANMESYKICILGDGREIGELEYYRESRVGAEK